MNDPTTTRRTALGRALAASVGALAAGTVAGTAEASGTTLNLTVRHVQMRGAEGQRHADLLGMDGVSVGRLAGTRLPLATPFGSRGAPSAIELHTLTLAGGALLAQGAVDQDGGTFHITGGTGRYAGARGSYELRLGHGTASIGLTIVAEEAR